MRDVLSKFIVATALVGITACKGAEDEKRTPLVFKGNVEVEKTPPIPRTTETERINNLAFARLNSAFVRSQTIKAIRGSQFLRLFAEHEVMTPAMCEMVMKDVAKEVMSRLTENYNASLTREITYGGQTEKGKVKALELMKEADGIVEKNIDVAHQECVLKFGA